MTVHLIQMRSSAGEPSGGLASVVAGGYCVGCGACKVASGGSITMARDQYGAMQAQLSAADPTALARGATVCPFADAAADEDELARVRFAELPEYDRRLGYHRAILAGRVQHDDVVGSSSGGLTSWVLTALLRAGAIDGVIHVGACERPSGELFGYTTSHTSSEILGKRRSQYYSVDFAEVLLRVRGNGKRYAFVGVPCFVKAARLLCQRDAQLAAQLQFFLALVCGHMKTAAYAQLLAWQVGVPPQQLGAVDFRVKVPGRSSRDYKFRAEDRAATRTGERMSRELVGGHWRHATFQLAACDFCDDVFGETADAAFGDAWLPGYVMDWRGTNVVVVRHPLIQSLLAAGGDRGELALEDLSVESAVRSQEANYRHRWDGLSVRLQDAQRARTWTPRKRITAGSRAVDPVRRRIVRLRQRMATRSHQLFLTAKCVGDLRVYTRPMAHYARLMELYYRMLGLRTPAQLAAAVRDKLTRWLTSAAPQ